MPGRCCRIGKAKPRELLAKDVRIIGQLTPFVGGEAVEDCAGTFDRGAHQIEQSAGVRESVKLRHIVESGRIGGKQVRLGVVHHLDAVLDRPEQPIRLCKIASDRLLQPARRE